jgi:hypothetical protein
MLKRDYEWIIINYELWLLWKWEASSKNNENFCRVRRCSSACKGVIFLFAYWDVTDCFCGKVDAIYLKERECYKFVGIILRNGMA